MDSKRSNTKTKRGIPPKTYGRDYAWEQRINKERQAANEYDGKWGFMKSKKNTNSISANLTDAGPINQYPVASNRTKNTYKIGEKEYDLSLLHPLNKKKEKDVMLSTHNFKEPKQESLPGQPIYSNSNRLRYQFKIKPGLPQETYDYPVTGNMEYGWKWIDRDIDGMFGSLNVNPVKQAMNRWKLEKKS